MSKKLLFFVIILLLTTNKLWMQEQEENEPEIQQFLFYIEEAYIQEMGEPQVGFSFEKWKNEEDNFEAKSSQIDLEFEYGILEWMQLEINLPYLSSETKSYGKKISNSGIGDISAGLGFMLSKEESDKLIPTISAGLEIILPTGEWKKGLGTGGFGLETGFAASKSFDDIYIHFNAGYARILSAESASGSFDIDEIEIGSALVYKPEGRFEFIFEAGLEIEKENGESETEKFIVPGIRYELIKNLEVGLGVPFIFQDEVESRLIIKTQYEF